MFDTKVGVGRRRLHSGVLAGVAGASLLILSAPAFAQPSLPPIDETSYTASQQRQIADYVAWLAEEIGEGDPDAVEAAREEAADALDPGRVSARFRSTFAAAALGSDGPLTPLLVAEHDHRAINALLVAGMVADRRTPRAVAEAFEDDRPAIRAAAAAALRLTLTRAASESAAGGPIVESAYETLRSALLEEPEAGPAKAIVGAMLSVPGQQATFDAGLRRAAAALRERTIELRDVPTDELLETGEIAAEPLTGWLAVHGALLAQANRRVLNAGADADLNRQMLADLAFISGMTLAYVRDAALYLDEVGPSGGELSDLPDATEFAESHRQLVGVSEQLLLSIQAQIFRQPIGRPRVLPALTDFIDEGDADALEEAVAVWVGRRGVLIDAPFSFDASLFSPR